MCADEDKSMARVWKNGHGKLGFMQPLIGQRRFVEHHSRPLK
jgi:hypothetical protein